MKELHILIVGHACFPNMGSEAGVTWNWAWHLAERNRVWVIAHGFARPLVEQYMHDHPRPNLHFIWVGPLGWWDPWKDPTPHEGARPPPSLPALAARGCRSGAAAHGHGVDRHCSSRQLEFNQRTATAMAYRQTLRLGTDRWRTSSALALSDRRRPRCCTGAASQPARWHHAVDTEPAPYRRADRSAAGRKRRERQRAAPGWRGTRKVAAGHRHPSRAPSAAVS
jgi:hypothetical protein